MADGTTGSDWANYSQYATDIADAIRRGHESVTVKIAGTTVHARSLSVVQDTLVVGVAPTEMVGSSFRADKPVALSTPEETVTVRLRDVTFDIEGTLLSFERVSR